MAAIEPKDFETEVEELGELIDMHELITQTEFKPNRAARRADIKRNRALQKRNPRG